MDYVIADARCRYCGAEFPVAMGHAINRWHGKHPFDADIIEGTYRRFVASEEPSYSVDLVKVVDGGEVRADR